MAFKSHLKQRYQPRCVSRFVPAGPDLALECAGPIDTKGGCPHQHVVALPKLASLSSVGAAQASESLKCLHLDHEIEVQQICDVWKKLTPPRLAAWDENVKPSRLCELIFGGVEAGSSTETRGRSNVQFRCACWLQLRHVPWNLDTALWACSQARRPAKVSRLTFYYKSIHDSTFNAGF
jgi:hypothetical protein